MLKSSILGPKWALVDKIHFPSLYILWSKVEKRMENIENKLGLSCAKLSLASAKLHTSLSSDQLKIATN